MELLSNIQESIMEDKLDKIAELEKETQLIKEKNPYNISDELAENGFIATYDALYRLYALDRGRTEYYLKIAREDSKKFKINYSWCVKNGDDFDDRSPIFSSTQTILESIEKRNKMLGKYTKDYNLPRNKQTVAIFLNETWKYIINDKEHLKIFKDKDSEFHKDKYSDDTIMRDYLTLSDIVVDGDFEFRLLHAKNECYYLFVHDTRNNEYSNINFSWQDAPITILKADEFDDKIVLLSEKIQSIEPTLDVFKIKDCLFKSLLEVDKDMDKKLLLLNNASSEIKTILDSVISTLRNKYYDDLNKLIKNKFDEHKAPSIQMLADYLNSSDEFFVVHDIKKKFKKTMNGFVEITTKDISNFFNSEFGFNKISMKKCSECMDYITRELTIDYNVIQFKNGLYNTKTGRFYADKFLTDHIPKSNLSDFSYHENAESEFKNTPLYNEVSAILKTDREHWKDWNEHVFFKSVGSCYHATNVADKLFVITGKPDARKSTLLTIIKRMFNSNYCNLKIHDIVKNERFVLVPCVNKAILIDDDASDLQINNIGNLNSFVSGTGLYVEFKNLNDGVHLNQYNTPRGWCACNDIFNVVGAGFKRRLCLILCDNSFDKDNSTKSYMVDIEEGVRDKEIELMISYCLQLYESEKDKSFLTQEQEDIMFAEFEFKSYPERRFVQDVFMYGDELAEIMEDDNNYSDVDVRRWSINYQDLSNVESVGDSSDNGTDASIPVIIPTILKIKDATAICRKYFRYQKQKGTIFDSQAIPSSKRIKTAMEMFGFNQTSKNITNFGKRSSIRVYENIVIKEDWIEKLGLKKLIESIVDNDLDITTKTNFEHVEKESGDCE